MMNNNDSVKIATYRGSYIVEGMLFAVIFLLSMTLFNFVSYEASGIAMNLVSGAAYISAFICAAVLCVRCAKVNKIKNPDIYIPPRDMIYYFKRAGFFALMIVLMSVAASFLGMCVIALFGGLLMRIENAFLSEFAVKLPVFIIYISMVYKMLVRFGFMDSQKKIFNPNFKMLTFMISFIMMLPGAVYDSFFAIPAVNALFVNVQTVISPNIGVYIVESDGYFYVNKDFGIINVILIALTVLATFAIQAFVFWYAYMRGKQIFIKQHIREVDEYEMNENI